MLVLVFRGIVLLGVLSWYSTHVWKMIDTYFKERFDKYLQHEYEKNPRMREHVVAGRESNEDTGKNTVQEGSVEKRVTLSKIDHQQSSCKGLNGLGEEVCTLDESSMKKLAGDGPAGSASTSGKDAIDDNLPSESEVGSEGATDKKARVETSSSGDTLKDERLVSNAKFKSSTSKGSTKSKLTVSTRDDFDVNVASKMSNLKADSSKVATDDPAILATSKRSANKGTRKRLKLRKKSAIRTSANDEMETKNKKQKLRVKTIFFTEKDFEDAKIRSGWQDYDFTEFDDEDEDGIREPPEGILVSQLPFKPRADIGKLERVSEDEFCPLTLEDEASCDEIRTWP